jgi:uncharacterized protein YdhG (YjbR/CyaY superfamily)
MKSKKPENIKLSQPREVDEYMSKLKHPLKKVVEALRQIILATNKEIGEEIKWNAPHLFFLREP